MVNGRLCLFTLTPEPVYSWCSSSSCSSESLWWRSYAESESTAALSSSSLSWVQSSSNSSRTPSWRRQTSWRWQSVSWGACSTSSCCSSVRLRTWQQWTRVTPGVSKWCNTSCPGSRWRRSPRYDWWNTLTSCSLPLRRTWQQLTSLLWAPRSTPASPKSKVRSTAPSGGRGRHLHTGKMAILVKSSYQTDFEMYLRVQSEVVKFYFMVSFDWYLYICSKICLKNVLGLYIYF